LLPSKPEALSSNPSTDKKRQGKKGRKGGRQRQGGKRKKEERKYRGFRVVCGLREAA
jgi:hypothetical protein